ncbi:MAG: S8 family serine peptidase [Gemmatimonadaceae bacterium]|nr:S8 family serine peptidase [Gemmatimonadaceae bacterium]
MHDVLQQIRAPMAWASSRGAGARIAVIDSGISGQLREFPVAKRSAESRCFIRSQDPLVRDPWFDPDGHGSMIAGIAAATRADQGRYDGVAPDAEVISCKTRTDAVDIFLAFDRLRALLRRGQLKNLVVLCAFAFQEASSPDDERVDLLIEVVRDIIARGAVVVFAAGNNHPPVGWTGSVGHMSGNSIWGPGSLDEVLCVGSVSEAEDMAAPPGGHDAEGHHRSSHGPGEFAQSYPKPDCVAPTYGEVIWRDGYRARLWWGSSGAAAQAAGLAALIRAQYPTLSPAEVARAIRGSCRGLNLAPTQCGAGCIDCAAALRAASPL